MKVVLSLLLLAVLGSCGLYESSSHVINLKKDTFEKEVLESKQLWIVEFYAPWCGHCKTLSPIFEELAKGFEGIIKFGAVDMTTDKEAGEAYKIQSYPTLKFFGVDKTKPIDYNEERSKSDFIVFLTEQIKAIVAAKIDHKPTGIEEEIAKFIKQRKAEIQKAKMEEYQK